MILSKEGTQTSLAVHRLVMESFKGIDFETLQKGFEVHHLDENHDNNRLSNLMILCPTCHRGISLGYYILNEDDTFSMIDENGHILDMEFRDGI